MASNLSLTLNLTGSGTLSGTAGITTPASVLSIGQNWPAMQTKLTYGTASLQAKNWVMQQRTLGAGLNDDLDLAGGLANELGDAGIIFLAVKVLLIAIISPDGVKKLKVGPGAAGAAVANAFVGPWANVASSFTTIDSFGMPINNPWGGYAVTPGTADVLRINNPGAGSVTYDILIAGTV
jgi:hypothetical protein